MSQLYGAVKRQSFFHHFFVLSDIITIVATVIDCEEVVAAAEFTQPQDGIRRIGLGPRLLHFVEFPTQLCSTGDAVCFLIVI